VQVTQVLTTEPMRPADIGRLHLDFYVKSSLPQTPLTTFVGMPAPLAVSSPEATALDLVAFSHRIGGIRRIAEMISELKSTMTLAGLRAALRAEPQIAVAEELRVDRVTMCCCPGEMPIVVDPLDSAPRFIEQS